MKIILDKISSVTKNANLAHEVEVSKNIEACEGAVIAVKVLEDKKIYNQLELTTGRMSTLKKGDTLAVALGNRKALKGFVGEVPQKLQTGDVIHILNIGGVAGICTSANLKEVGKPLQAKVIGAIIGTDAKPVNIKQFKLFEPRKNLKSKIPLIIVSGTCMNVGKTSTACEIIKHASRRGFKASAAKLTGVASLKDIKNMEDYGAQNAVTFVDAGYTSTSKNKDTAIATAKGAINYLSDGKPDYIIIEFGDGIFGEYGVMDILKDKEIQKNIAVHIGCAHDPVGATKLFEVCKKIGTPLNIISGPVTDNSIGTDFIKKHLKLPAINALTSGEDLFYCAFRYLSFCPRFKRCHTKLRIPHAVMRCSKVSS